MLEKRGWLPPTAHATGRMILFAPSTPAEFDLAHPIS